MTERIGLITGFEAFGGLSANPSERLLPWLEGLKQGDITVKTRTLPVKAAEASALIPSLVDRHKPAFVLGLGVAVGAPVIRVETFAVNAANFRVPDNAGELRRHEPVDPAGPAGRRATYDAEAVRRAVLEAGVPAALSYSAGTHLCNLALYAFLGALEAAGLNVPCGFLHLPCLPEQVVELMRRQADQPQTLPVAPVDLPSMALTLQEKAVKAAVAAMVAPAEASSPA